jgi:hypothetical protein
MANWDNALRLARLIRKRQLEMLVDAIVCYDGDLSAEVVTHPTPYEELTGMTIDGKVLA